MAITDSPLATRSPRTVPAVVAGAVLSAALSAVGSFTDLTDNSTAEHSVGQYLVTVGVIAVAALVVIATAGKGGSGRRPGRAAVLHGVIGLLTIVLFWTGLPPVLAAGAIACALAERDRLGSFGGGSGTGLALAGLTLTAASVLAVVG